jgi:general L-amino acid transport system substrate-binding protein
MILRLMALTCLAGVLAGPALAGATPAGGTPAGGTLDKVRAAGALTCGVIAEPEDYTKADLHAPLAPLSAEICKAVAVAALGARAKVALKVYSIELDAEEGLHKGEVDLIVGATPDATSMWHWQISFGPPVFYDAQGFLVRPDAHAASLAQLAGRKVCYIEGTDNEKILLARTVARGIAVIPLPFQEEGEMEDGLAVGHCDAISADLSRLAQARANFPKQIGNDIVLPDLLTLHPAAPAYRQGDAQWASIVDWTIYVLIQAEASGVTQANVAAQRNSEDPVVQRLLGVDWASSRALGLAAHDWSAQVIAVVGNYGEIYARTVGAADGLQLPRGLNALWTEGGLMHPLPVQ